VTRIETATGRAGRPVRVGSSPTAVAVSGSAAYVVSTISAALAKVSAAGPAEKPVSVGLYSYPAELAFAGTTAVVIDNYASQVSLVDTRTGHAYRPVRVGPSPDAVAITG
jgi:DNA-binding beta-propeller fold protein YncE